MSDISNFLKQKQQSTYIIQQAENQWLKEIDDNDIDDFYNDETSLNGIQLMSIMDEEECQLPAPEWIGL